MRILLNRPKLADLAIMDLARWQDWSVAGRLMRLYDTEEYDLPAIKRAVIRYFLIAEHATREETGSSMSEHVRIAAANLAALRESDPEAVKRAKRLFFPPNP